MSREKTSATASDSGRKTMKAAYAVDRICVGIPTPRARVQQRGRIVTREQGAIEVGQRAVEAVAGPQQRDDRLQVAVRHVAHVEAAQGGARRDRPRRGPALAPDAAQRGARRPARARAMGGADHDVDRDEQRHAEADEHEVERGDVVGIAQRHLRGVGRDQPDDDQEHGDDRAGQHAAPARRLHRGRDGAGRLGAASGLATGFEQRSRRHRQAGVGLGAGTCRRAVRRSIPTSARARASDVTAMARPARSSRT